MVQSLMTKLAAFKFSARKDAEYRGHKLGKFQHIGDYTYLATCKICGKDVTIKMIPQPNETNIAGEAVSTTCNPRILRLMPNLEVA